MPTSFAYVLGAIVVVRYRILFRIAAHHARHPLDVRRLRRDGILNYTKETPIVPYGFRDPTTWTSEPPTCPHCKHDALPVHTIEMLTRHNIFGSRLGTSLFIDGSASRETRREWYEQGLTQDRIERDYKRHMRRLSPFHITSVPDAVTLASDLTFWIHFDRQGTSTELDAVRTMCWRLTESLNGHPFTTAEREKKVLHAACTVCRDGMIGAWRTAGMSTEDCYVELAHNIFGMTIQWAYLFLHWRNVSSLPEATEMVLDVLPAKVAASRVDDGRRLLIHDLQARCTRASRPVSVTTGGLPGEDDPNYVPFGSGSRRCPGEWLTYALLLTMRGRVDPEIDYAAHRFLGVNVLS